MTTTRIQVRRGTAATWVSTNPKLAAGEIGFETDTGKFKIGNGTSFWNSLNYAVPTNTGISSTSSPLLYDSDTRALSLDYGTGLTLSAGKLVPNFGNVSGRVAEGNHGHSSDYAPTSHTHSGVYDPAGTAATAVSTHEADTTSVHGITNTADLVLTTDSRLSNARTPTAHKSSHSSGGTDALTPSDIGAATSNHTHTSGGGSSEQLIGVISQNGYITGPMSGVGGRAYVKGNWTISQVRASLGNPVQGQSVIVDINKNGTSLFTTQANRPMITSTNYTSAKTNMDVTSITDGQYLSVDVDQADVWPWAFDNTSPVSAAAWTYGAYGNNTFVVASASGLIYSSSDGKAWTLRTSQFSTSTIRKVIYAGGLFVAVGDSGLISTSADGATWTARTSGSSDNFRDIAHNGTRFVAVGGVTGDISYSANGTSWTTVTTSSSGLNAVVPVNNNWVAVGQAGVIFTAADGTPGTWTSRTSNTVSNLNAVKFANSIIVAAGASGTVVTAVPTDLTSWVVRNVPVSPSVELAASTYYGNKTIAYDGTNWYIIGSGTLLTSTNGTSWYFNRPYSQAGSFTLYFINVTSSGYIIIGGGSGLLAMSRDKGANFYMIPNPLGAVSVDSHWYFEGGTTSVVTGGSSTRTIYAENSPLPAADLTIQVYGTPA